MNQPIQECSCQRCGHVWRTSEQGLQRPCPQCGSTTFLYQEVTRANVRAAKRLEKSSRWPLRVDVAIGVLMAWIVIGVLTGLAFVAFLVVAADSVEDQLEVPQEELLLCPDGPIPMTADGTCP